MNKDIDYPHYIFREKIKLCLGNIHNAYKEEDRC